VPPPVAPHTDDPAPFARGTVLAQLTVAVGDARAAEVRVSWQATGDLRAGVGVAIASAQAGSEHDRHQFLGLRLVAVRAFASWNPATITWGELTAGASYGRADTGLRYVAFDGGAALATPTDRVAGGLALSYGASIPLAAGRDWFADHPAPPGEPHGDFPIFAVNDGALAPAHRAPDATTRWLGVEVFGVVRWGDRPERAAVDLGLLSNSVGEGVGFVAAGYGVGAR
jgi:hypothetical protein